jgi:ABC-type lipoprotein export system ATPase subunit
MIQLSDLRPHPLISLGLNPASDIFGGTCKFEEGKHYLVQAPSGRGKSTFLHCLYGLRTDYEGRILLDDRATSSLKADDWATIRQRYFSIVFQDIRLFDQLTAIENIELNNNLSGSRSPEEINEWALRLGVRPLLDKKVERLSYGQQQRVAIIRALCQPFKFLLLDEPFSHLDAENTQLALQLALEVCQEQQAGMILVSLGEHFDHEYDAELIL